MAHRRSRGHRWENTEMKRAPACLTCLGGDEVGWCVSSNFQVPLPLASHRSGAPTADAHAATKRTQDTHTHNRSRGPIEQSEPATHDALGPLWSQVADKHGQKMEMDHAKKNTDHMLLKRWASKQQWRAVGAYALPGRAKTQKRSGYVVPHHAIPTHIGIPSRRRTSATFVRSPDAWPFAIARRVAVFEAGGQEE